MINTIGSKYLRIHLLSISAFLFFAFSTANLANAYDVFVGTQSASDYLSGEVFRYEGGTSWTSLSAGTYLGKAIMDMEVLDGNLYASTYDGSNKLGKVWRYDGDNLWTEVGELDMIVADMVVYRDELYAVTTANSNPMGRIYRYNGTPGDWALVGTDTGPHSTGFFAATISDVSGSEEIVIGDRVTDRWSTYSPETGLVFRQDSGGSCVWDIEELDGLLYSGNFWGPIFKSTDGRNWARILYEDGHHWDVEAFQGKLYVGGSGYRGEDGSQYSGRLSVLEGSTLQKVWDYNRSLDYDGISRLEASPDESILFIGTGVRDGYFGGNGLAEVWAYDGTDVNKISPNDFFGGGVQSLLATDLEVIDVAIDIKPQSCPNTINVQKNGVLSVAILGTADFDATQIDSSSVKLKGVSALRSNLEDVATPSEENSCTEEGADGYLDLVLKFDTQSIVQKLKAEDEEELTLRLRGYLAEEFGGAAISGKDMVVILNKSKPEGAPIQWAATATASSEWSSDSWSAWQATGEPNTFACGDIETAWAPLSSGSAPEWIELGFGAPVNAMGLLVHETYESGFIYQIDLIGVDGEYHTVWTGTDTTGCPGWFEISFDETDYLVEGVKLYTQINGWEEVDAVALIAAPEKQNQGKGNK